jgi:hypothetical protein
MPAQSIIPACCKPAVNDHGSSHVHRLSHEAHEQDVLHQAMHMGDVSCGERHWSRQCSLRCKLCCSEIGPGEIDEQVKDG